MIEWEQLRHPLIVTGYSIYFGDSTKNISQEKGDKSEAAPSCLSYADPWENFRELKEWNNFILRRMKRFAQIV